MVWTAHRGRNPFILDEADTSSEEEESESGEENDSGGTWPVRSEKRW